MLVTIVDDLLICVIVDGSNKKRGSAVDGCYKMVIIWKITRQNIPIVMGRYVGSANGNVRGWRWRLVLLCSCGVTLEGRGTLTVRSQNL